MNPTNLTRRLVLLALPLAAAGCASTRSRPAHAVEIGLRDSGGVVRLNRGQVLIVSLILAEGTGCRWFQIGAAGPVLATRDHGQQAVGGGPLGSIVRRGHIEEVFTFQAARRGTQTLAFGLKPGNQPGGPADQTAAFDILVD